MNFIRIEVVVMAAGRNLLEHGRSSYDIKCSLCVSCSSTSRIPWQWKHVVSTQSWHTPPSMKRSLVVVVGVLPDV
jgi:hypothetical protein